MPSQKMLLETSNIYKLCFPKSSTCCATVNECPYHSLPVPGWLAAEHCHPFCLPIQSVKRCKKPPFTLLSINASLEVRGPLCSFHPLRIYSSLVLNRFGSRFQSLWTTSFQLRRCAAHFLDEWLPIIQVTVLHPTALAANCNFRHG